MVSTCAFLKHTAMGRRAGWKGGRHLACQVEYLNLLCTAHFKGRTQCIQLSVSLDCNFNDPGSPAAGEKAALALLESGPLFAPSSLKWLHGSKTVARSVGLEYDGHCLAERKHLQGIRFSRGLQSAKGANRAPDISPCCGFRHRLLGQFFETILFGGVMIEGSQGCLVGWKYREPWRKGTHSNLPRPPIAHSPLHPQPTGPWTCAAPRTAGGAIGISISSSVKEGSNAQVTLGFLQKALYAPSASKPRNFLARK